MDKDQFGRFKQAYAQAVEKGETSFFYNGTEFITEYAKFMIEHLESLNLPKK